MFLAEKDFEGAGGLEMTDEIRVTIAAQACVLLLHRDTDYYPALRSVIVYPSAYVAEESQETAHGWVSEDAEARLGQSSAPLGAMVLSWDDVRAGAADVRDGENLVFHEFAHQLDFESGEYDGTPVLERRSMYVAWARVLGREYERLRRDAASGRETVLDAYGATDPAEFFAVATECFFEKSRQLRDRHPALYEELKRYYRQDPARLPEGEA